MVHSLIGLFCCASGTLPATPSSPTAFSTTFSPTSAPTGDLHLPRATRRRSTTTRRRSAGLEAEIVSHGVRTTGAVMQHVVVRTDGSSGSACLPLRQCRSTAAGFVDASGDAALAWEAGLPCWLPERPIYGSQQVIVEDVDESASPTPGEMDARIAAKAGEYGLLRRGGLAFYFPGRGTAVLNVTHIEAPPGPGRAPRRPTRREGTGRRGDRAAARRVPEGVRRGPGARLRLSGTPADPLDQGGHQLTLDEVRAGTRFPDAVARTAWPIELHDRADGYVWETFEPDHVHYVPLRSMTPPDVHNLVAAGRCVDGDAAALSSVRVMGPCAAMGAAAAHALDLAGNGSVHDIDLDRLRDRLARNLG